MLHVVSAGLTDGAAFSFELYHGDLTQPGALVLTMEGASQSFSVWHLSPPCSFTPRQANLSFSAGRLVSKTTEAETAAPGKGYSQILIRDPSAAFYWSTQMAWAAQIQGEGKQDPTFWCKEKHMYIEIELLAATTGNKLLHKWSSSGNLRTVLIRYKSNRTAGFNLRTVFSIQDKLFHSFCNADKSIQP